MKIPEAGSSPAMQRLLAALTAKNGMSASDLAREAFVGLTTLACGGYLKALRDARLVHVSGWRKTPKGFVTPLYSLGNKPDMRRPGFTDVDRDSAGMGRIVAALEARGAMTYRELAEASGLSANTIKNARYMDILIAQKRVHIIGWRRNRAGPMTALYLAGTGQAAPRPAAFSGAEKCRRARSKAQALSVGRSVASQMARL